MFNSPRKSAALFALVGLCAACQSRFDGVSISELPPATSDAEKREVRASDTFAVGGREVRVGWHTLLRSGQSVGDGPNHVFGQRVDDSGEPLPSEDFVDSNAFSSLLSLSGTVFSIAQFASRPGAVYLSELAQNRSNGALSAVSTQAVSLERIHGAWSPSAGVVTPWSTHLGAEASEPDAAIGGTSAAAMAPFFGGGTRPGGDASRVNPYFYGFTFELALQHGGDDVSVVKHYSMGRFAHGTPYVLPDRTTVYEADDGSNVGFFRYVADAAGDLSSGSLYALKWTQSSAPGSTELGEADVSWIALGHASDGDISNIIDSGIGFADIFDSAPSSNGECPSEFSSLNANGIGQECLKLKPGRELAAAFLETRRYAAMRGATSELSGESGITFDPDTRRLYVAYRTVQYGMEDAMKNGTANATYDIGTNNDVKLRFNTCGAIYAYELDDDFIATHAVGVLAGRMTTAIDPNKLSPSTIDAAVGGNTCDVESLANPSSLSFVTGGRALVIGEDSADGHQNDAVWIYQLDARALTRIETTPYGSATASNDYYGNLGGYAYVASVVQHPFGESDMDKLTDPEDASSYFGYIGPVPVSRDAWR